MNGTRSVRTPPCRRHPNTSGPVDRRRRRDPAVVGGHEPGSGLLGQLHQRRDHLAVLHHPVVLELQPVALGSEQVPGFVIDDGEIEEAE